MSYVTELDYSKGDIAILRRNKHGEPELWVHRTWIGAPIRQRIAYYLNDMNTGTEVGDDEDLDQIVADWEAAVAQ